MKFKVIYIAIILVISACTSNKEKETEETHDHKHDDHAQHDEEQSLHLSVEKFESLNLKFDKLKERNIEDIVEVNGYLEVPPQNEATITAIIGANVHSIQVIEGEKINKNQVLAYLQHPDLIKLQTQYIQQKSNLDYLQKSLDRTEKLYKEKIASGKELQEIQSKQIAVKGEVLGLESQLKMLSLNPNSILNGKIYDRVPVKSPIKGYIRKVKIKTGQFVSPSKEMFEVVNNEHVHADLMVYEKDVMKVKEGQFINFKLHTAPGQNFEAKIFSIGKAFETDPKAVHIHADIITKEDFMLPGMYVQGQINTADNKVIALPNDAITAKDGKNYVFSIIKKNNEFTLSPIEVLLGISNNEFTEVLLPEKYRSAFFLQNKAYYLMAEMQKGEAEHSH